MYEWLKIVWRKKSRIESIREIENFYLHKEELSSYEQREL